MSTSPSVTPKSEYKRFEIPPVKYGDHVLYVEEGKVVEHALVQIVFSEYGLPCLTLITITRGKLVTRIQIPHRDHREGGRKYWIFPHEQ